MSRKRLKHSSRHSCPNCGKDAKIRNRRTHLVFVCICGFNIQAPDMETLKRMVGQAREMRSLIRAKTFAFGMHMAKQVDAGMV